MLLLRVPIRSQTLSEFIFWMILGLLSSQKARSARAAAVSRAPRGRALQDCQI